MNLVRSTGCSGASVIGKPNQDGSDLGVAASPSAYLGYLCQTSHLCREFFVGSVQHVRLD